MSNRKYSGAFGSMSVIIGAGGALLIWEAVWITYGVFMRYILRNPDTTVTEGSTLLLMPLAFIGLPYAFREQALPRVTIFIDRLPRLLRQIVDLVTQALVAVLGVYLLIASGFAIVRTYQSGAASEITGWPDFVVWIPVFLIFGVFAFASVCQVATWLSKNSSSESAHPNGC